MVQEDIRRIIEVLCERLIADYSPSKVILFGSHASGQGTEDSDIDLLIIKETTERFLDRWSSVRKVLAGYHRSIPLDTLVLTPDEIESRLAMGDQFIAEIINNGEILYAA